jgi:hypothetical protein
MVRPDEYPSRWVNYAACVWAVVFAAPHTWWALGLSAGFPGGEANHRLMMSTPWRYDFDWVVIFLSLTAVFIALALVHSWGRRIPRWLPRTAAWIAAALLGLRGVAGLLADGLSDPIWWPAFLTGGILFGLVAWRARVPPPDAKRAQAA